MDNLTESTLVDRHMTRHRQKDEEAGGEGLGVIETRKRLWRDSEGNIVSKRPAESDACKSATKKQTVGLNVQGQQIFADDFNNQMALHAAPLSPPGSMRSAESMDQFSHQLPELPEDHDFIDSTSGPDMFDFLANSSWGSHPSGMNMQLDAPFDDMFNPDTGKERSTAAHLR